MRIGFWAGVAIGLAGAAQAGVPRVAADIPPVAGLVARVMDGVGAPELVVPPGASPHGYALRPSEARVLSSADLVVWVGEALTPWLEHPLDTLAPEAARLELLAVPGTHLLTVRDGATFEPHHHEDEAGPDDHGHDEAGHDHEGTDPHAWLDPANAALWLGAIAEDLARLDPDHADRYRANAEAGAAEIARAAAAVTARLAPLSDRPFIVFHDAYHYAEAAFGVEAAGAMSLSDATEPGPARLAELRDAVRDMGVACVFTEPQFSPRLVATVTEGAGVRTAVLDPLGTGIAPGAAFYPAFLHQLGEAMAGCLE